MGASASVPKKANSPVPTPQPNVTTPTKGPIGAVAGTPAGVEQNTHNVPPQAKPTMGGRRKAQKNRKQKTRKSRK